MRAVLAARSPAAFSAATSRFVSRISTSGWPAFTSSPCFTSTLVTMPSVAANTSRFSTGSSVPLPCSWNSAGTKNSETKTASSTIATAMVLGSVRALTIHFDLPSVRHTGMRNRLLCSKALASATLPCSATTSIRRRMAAGMPSVLICSMIEAPR